MYLDDSEEGKVAREEEPCTEVMRTEQLQIAKLTEAAELTSQSKGSADLGIEVLVEYTEQTDVSRETETSIYCVEHCKMNRDETESCTYCSGLDVPFERYSTSNGLGESDRFVDRCETSGLIQSCHECGQHSECFNPCKSSEHCANHSVASKCTPCCEHCPEHLQSFQSCEPSHQQFKLAMNCDSFEQCELSDFIPECTDSIKLLRQYEPSDYQEKCFDTKPETSTEDSEQCKVTGITPNISDLQHSLDCDDDLCEYDRIVNQTEDSVDEENFGPEAELIDESFGKSNPSQCNTLAHVYFDDVKAVLFPRESGETNQLVEENYQLSNRATDHCEMCQTDNPEISHESTQQCTTTEHNSVRNCKLFSEEDGSSDCSSIETKSFKTCPEGSIPSDPYSDSSEESEKEAQEDSSDEQTQWESFEDGEETEQRNITGINEDNKKTPALDIVIEDYFDLFDRADNYGHVFVQKQHYISCFDGGDIDACLYLEEVLAKNINTHNDINDKMNVKESDTCSNSPEEASEEESMRDDASSGSCESEKQSDDWIVGSESSLAEDEAEESEFKAYDQYTENNDEAEEDEDAFDRIYFAIDYPVSEICEEDSAVCFSSGNRENMCAPCADDISVEGDAYEDEVYDDLDYNSKVDNSSINDNIQTSIIDCKEAIKVSSDIEFITCSEMEPYWSIVETIDNKEMYGQDVEDYYVYQIKSIQSSVKHDTNGFMLEGSSSDQIIFSDNGNEREDLLFSLRETELQEDVQMSPEECKAATKGIYEVNELSENVSKSSLVEKLAKEHTLESDDDCGLNDTSKDLNPPSDIIHSVVSELEHDEESEAQNKEEQSTDSEEEQSDDESSESCECEYCIPSTEQTSAKPLLPRVKSNDTGKICVVIDLDETLVHSSFKPVNNADFIIPVEIDGTVHQVYVLKRPHVDEFLKRMGELFECVLFTASLSKYADPVSDLLDKWGAFRSRLFRESCVFHKGNYVKDLSRLGRDLNKVIIIDNSPASYIFHPDNAVPVASWFDDMSDTELLDLIPFFERLSEVDDVYDFLTQQRTSS
ncbi:uncharacterized protein [Antennarius striatus]|uniref:uncharacterized protein isoform X1 n=1 Tax=Antennarius striatus TaxID=241820 RepID=UPI0035B0173D